MRPGVSFSCWDLQFRLYNSAAAPVLLIIESDHSRHAHIRPSGTACFVPLMHHQKDPAAQWLWRLLLFYQFTVWDRFYRPNRCSLLASMLCTNSRRCVKWKQAEAYQWLQRKLCKQERNGISRVDNSATSNWIWFIANRYLEAGCNVLSNEWSDVWR